MARNAVPDLRAVASIAQSLRLVNALDADLKLVAQMVQFSPFLETLFLSLRDDDPELRLGDLTTANAQAMLERTFDQSDLYHLQRQIIRRLPELDKAVARQRLLAKAREKAAAQRLEEEDGLRANMTLDGLRAWAETRGAGDLLDVYLGEVFAQQDSPQHWFFRDMTVADVLTTSHTYGYAAANHEIRTLCLSLLRQRAKEAKTSFAVAADQAAQRSAPTHKKLRSFYQKVQRRQQALRTIAPTVGVHTLPYRYAIRADPVGISLLLERDARGSCVANPVVNFVLADNGRASVQCICNKDRTRGTQRDCRTQVDALELMLDLLGMPQSAAIQPAIDDLTRHLSVPLGARQAQRYLRLLGLDEPASVPQIDGAAATPVWRLHEDKESWRLSPGLSRAKKSGVGIVVRAWAMPGAADWLEQHGEKRDQRLLGLVESLSDLRATNWVDTELAQANIREQILHLLIDHPHLYAAKGTARRIELTTAELHLRLDKSAKKAEIRAFIGEEPALDLLSDVNMEQIHYGDVLVWQPGELHGVVLHASQRALTGLALESTNKHRFAASALPQLRDKLMPLTQSGEVVFSTEVRGEHVPANAQPLVELAFDGAALRLCLRLEPLSGGALAVPADGPSIWYAMRDVTPVYCERDQQAEGQLADELWRELETIAGLSFDGADGLTEDHDDEQSGEQASEQASEQRSRWNAHVTDLDAALDLIGWLRRVADAETNADTDTDADTDIDADADADAETPALTADMARWRGLDIRWDSAPVTMLGQLSVKNLKVQIDAGRDWFGVQTALSVGGAVVPLQHLLAAARDAKRYVHVEGHGWLSVEAGLRRRLSALSGDGAGISPLAAPLIMALEEEGAEIDGPRKWLEMADRIRAAARLEPQVPSALNAELRPYQEEGFAWLSRLAAWAPGAILADDMGLGKTVQALALLLRRQPLGPALVVAPTSLGFNWLREAERFAPTLELRALRGKADIKVLENLGANVVVVTSWDVAVLQRERLQETTWATLVMDEAQAIKNPATRRAKAIVALDADFRLALTGTPMENHTGELWSLFRAAVPGLLGAQKRFRERFQIPIERHNDERAKAALVGLISPFLLRRLKQEVAQDLPSRTDILVDVELSKPERQRYEQLRASVAAELAKPASPDERGQVRRFRVLAALTRLRQLACHPKLFDPTYTGTSAKLEELRTRLDQLRSEGHRALVFSQFTSLLDLVRPVLEADGARTLQLDGRTPGRKRSALVEAFQAGEADVFLLSIKAGGTGLNLTAASYVFHLDPWWNPAVEDQATDRAHRIGQDQQVTVYRLVARATVEESIYAMHDEKRALTDALLSGATRSGPMKVEDLEAILLAHG